MHFHKSKTYSLLLVLIVFTLFLIDFSIAAEINNTYDSLNRLVKTFSIDGDQTTTIEYSYDGTGNMLQASYSLSYKDSDNDGVTDGKDKCPGTPPGNIVDNDGCMVIKGDINRDGDIDLKDSMLGLKILTSQKDSIDSVSDSDGDRKIGLGDTIYTIQQTQKTNEN